MSLHLPTLLVLSFAICSIVTLMLLFTRATLGATASSAFMWAGGDVLFQLARLGTLAERHRETLPFDITPYAPPAALLGVLPGVLMLLAVGCHAMALRQADGLATPWRRALPLLVLMAGGYALLARLGPEDIESRTQLLATMLVVPLLAISWFSARLACHFWSARIICALAVLSLLANVARMLDLAPQGPTGAPQSLSALYMLNVVMSLTVTVTFIALLQEKARERIVALSLTDPLTRLLNRRGLREQVARELARLRRRGTGLAVAVFDLDHFKRINDTQGHGKGDEVLAGFADCLRAQCRASDLLARWGGEEFVVVMPETSAVEAWAVAERVRRAVQGGLLAVGVPGVTVSAGVAQGLIAIGEAEVSNEKAGAQDPLTALVELADARLYVAKRQRDCVVGEGVAGEGVAPAADSSPDQPAARTALAPAA